MKKTAIITGGAHGIDKAIALKLLQQQIQVAIWDIAEQAGKETEAELQHHGKIKFFLVDIASEPQVREAIQATVAYFGGIDYLVNNAAISCNKPLAELTLAEWERVITVNLTGTFLCAKYAAPHLRERQGAIVNLCSTRAFMSEPNTEAYSASKGGIYALTHALAMSLGPEVRVNCISPGWIEVNNPEALTSSDHQQHPVGRVGKAEDVAALAWFLLSDESGFITGQNFIIDGGMTRKMIYL
ncbi:SDR family oxidoreductase [Carboxydocella sp. JDF658]|uniref:SDR family oxidoreductase n=1 Tax=Carboxydocella sp. JDF658 TaxID=1926600 RepID=UPI0009AE29BD|nr:SDR family oxidoreductase [Carboxydocella sp. JDF658]GAW31818.1 oxidoreductase [Carboxydocella sp. JDF658]